MTFEPVVGLLAAAGCGLAGLGVPTVVALLPPPAGEVAARPRVRVLAAAIAALAGFVVGATVGADWALLVLLPLVPLGTALGIIDARTHLLPTALIRPAFAVTVVLVPIAAVAGRDGMGVVIRAAVAAVIVLVCFHLLWMIHPAGMGYGDVRLATLLGFALGYLGWAELVVGIYGAFVVFALYGLVRAAARRERAALREAMPFGPYLLVGALAGVAVGAPVAGYLVAG